MRRLGLLIVLAVALSAPAFAQSYAFSSNARSCKDQSMTDLQQRADYCTTALQHSDEEGGAGDLAIAELLLYRADAYLTLKNFDQAIADADLAKDYHDIDAQVENMRCWTRAVANRELDVAVKACDEAIRLNKDDPAPRDSRGLVALRQGKWQEAYDAYKEPATFLIMPGSKYGLGLAALALGKTADGERWIKEVLERKPTAGDELNGFGFTPEKMKTIAAKVN